MPKGGEFITNLRRIFLIKNLLDCEKKTTRTLIDNIDKSIDDYFNGYPEIKPKNYKKLDYQTMNAILKEFLNTTTKENIPKEEEGIIKREIDEEKKGQGPKGYKYWINRNMNPGIFVFTFLIVGRLAILGKKESNINKPDFIQLGSEFINSPFAKPFLNLNLLRLFENVKEITIIHPLFKEFFLNAITISPTALLGFCSYTTSLKIQSNSKKPIKPPKESLEELYGIISNALTNDVLYSQFFSKTNFELRHEILLKIEGDSHLKIISIDTEYKDQKKINSMEWNAREMEDPNEKTPGYADFVDIDSGLSDLLNIYKAVIGEVIIKKPKLKNQFQKAFDKKRDEIKNINLKMKDESISYDIKDGFLSHLLK